MFMVSCVYIYIYIYIYMSCFLCPDLFADCFSIFRVSGPDQLDSMRKSLVSAVVARPELWCCILWTTNLYWRFFGQPSGGRNTFSKSTSKKQSSNIFQACRSYRNWYQSYVWFVATFLMWICCRGCSNNNVNTLQTCNFCAIWFRCKFKSLASRHERVGSTRCLRIPNSFHMSSKRHTNARARLTGLIYQWMQHCFVSCFVFCCGPRVRARGPQNSKYPYIDWQIHMKIHLWNAHHVFRLLVYLVFMGFSYEPALQGQLKDWSAHLELHCTKVGWPLS